jgi:tRNA pseudouridine38-40 synthase
MRIALRIEYDGRNFAGWERQPASRTVQGEIERALARVAAQPIHTICAGRTDAGVHAHGQVVHFDTASVRSERAWILGTNSNLPRDVSVTWARSVERTFHARFSARSRHYQYLILNRSVRPALWQGRVTWECRWLDESAMQAAGDYLLGEHDFSAYRAFACQARNPVRRIHRLEVRRNAEWLSIDVVANGFLHHMVRNIAGVLMAVGMGKNPPQWAREVMESRDRTRGGITAPPDGLYLVGVDYPPHFGIARLSAPAVVG